MKICTKIENGKAFLEFDFAKEIADAKKDMRGILLQIQNQEQQVVLRVLYLLSEEEPGVGLLLHPHLWNGVADPYLYQACEYAIGDGGKMDLIGKQKLALYTLEEFPGKGWMLNGHPYEIYPICWEWQGGRETLSDDLNQLIAMGGNAIYLSSALEDSERFVQEEYDTLRGLCMEKGLLLWEHEEKESECPRLSQLFYEEHSLFTDAYYRYQAQWSKIPCLHISINSLKKSDKGRYSIKIYSNQKKVALYIEGILYEVLSGNVEYFFEEIPIQRYPTVITAQAGECFTAFTLYERSHNFHKFITFS